MREADRHRALAKIVAIRTAERAAARYALLLAGAREREAVAAHESAEEQVRGAAGAWQEHLAGGFDPQLARAHASALIESTEACAAAAEHAAEAAEARETSTAEYRAGDARCRQAEQSLDASRRARAQHREERALEALADRVTFDWTRR